MSIYSTWREYWRVCLAVAIGCASVLLSQDSLKREFIRGVVPAITVSAVLLTTLVTFVLFLIATDDELELAHHYNYIQKIGNPQWPDFLVIFVLALGFGALIAFVSNPLIYAATIVLFQGADTIGTSLLQNRVARARKEAASMPNAIYDYYLLRPHSSLRTLRLLGYFLAFTIALVARFKPSVVLIESCWTVILATTITCEFYLRHWRNELSRQLELEDVSLQQSVVPRLAPSAVQHSVRGLLRKRLPKRLVR